MCGVIQRGDSTMRIRWLYSAVTTLALILASLGAGAQTARAQTQVISDLTPAEVFGLFNTLHRSRDWIEKKLEVKGSKVRTRFKTTRVAPMISADAAKKFDALNQPWVIDVVHEGLFQLKDVSST